MATQLQIAANRRNALRSTGPRTVRGKSISRINALKHGLSAEPVVLFDEEVTEFERFFRKWMGACKPQGFVERQLVERIAICAWRLRRVYRIETGLFSKYRTDWTKGMTGLPIAIETTFFRASAADNTLEKLTRYERSIERSLRQILLDFYAMKGTRRSRYPSAR
jgi:hypothetical protein